MQKITNFLKSENFIFFLFFLFLFSLQAKSLTTGDGGELIGASFGLGIAHPSGYPVYLLLGKLTTLIPLGNIPLKVTLLSTLSSTILLTLIFNYFKKNYSFYTALFSCLLLLSSYSFVGQSLVAKFYPLNTLLILIIFYFGLKSLQEYKLVYQLIISFLLGLSLGLHHTTLMILLPLTFPLFLHFKKALKNILFSLFFFFLGASSVLYLWIRSLKPVLINVSPSPNFSALLYTLLRKTYQKGASTELAKSLVSIDFAKLINATKNIYLLIEKQFHLYSFIFFLIGIIFLIYKKKYRQFFYLLFSLFTYSIILAYLGFAQPDLDLHSWYIAGHQYFLPALIFYVLVCGIGFFYLEKKLKLTKYIFLIFPLIYIPNHFFINNFDSNQIAKYKTIDSLFSKPIKSIIIYSGDNDVFQGWYQKNIEKFRDDICILSAPVIGSEKWEIENGCNSFIYQKAYPQIHDQDSVFNLAKLRDYMLKFRVYSSSPIENNKVLSPYLNSYYSVLDFLVIPKKNTLQPNLIEKFNQDLRKQKKEFLHFDKCLTNESDDVFSRALCAKYSSFLTFLAYDFSKEYPQGKPLKKKIKFENKDYELSLFLNAHTKPLLLESMLIEKNNNVREFYLYAQENTN